DEECGQAVYRWFDNCGALLLGRNTYDEFASHWPQVTDPDDPVAGLTNNNTNYVVTSSPVGDVRQLAPRCSVMTFLGKSHGSKGSPAPKNFKSTAASSQRALSIWPG